MAEIMVGEDGEGIQGLVDTFKDVRDRDPEATEAAEGLLRERANMFLEQIMPAGVQYSVAKRGPHVSINEGDVMIFMDFPQRIDNQVITSNLRDKVPGGRFIQRDPSYGWFIIPVADFDAVTIG